MNGEFKDSTSLEKRVVLAQNILLKHPGCVPLILEAYDKKIQLNKTKFIIPGTLTVGQFLTDIHKKVLVNSKETIFLFCNQNVLIPTSLSLDAVYQKYKDNDGFLYLLVTKENTFGSL